MEQDKPRWGGQGWLMEGSESRTHELGFYHEGSGQPAGSPLRGTVISAF